MANLNKVIIIGRIGSDLELKHTPIGQPVTSFSLATSKRYKDKQGNQQEKTEWHNIVAWQKSAELINQYCAKGSELYIEGELHTRMWEKDGNKFYKTEINVFNFQFVGGKNKDSQQNSNNKPNFNNSSSYEIPDTDFNDDDLPF